MMMLIYWILLASLFQIYCCSFTDRIEITTNKIKIRYKYQTKDDTSDFSQTVDTSLFGGTKATECSSKKNEFCIEWGNRGQFRIKTIDEFCENFHFWTTFNKRLNVEFDRSNIHLYGGSEIDNQTWPISVDERIDPFVSTEFNSKSILEPLWYTSNGFYLHVEDKVPLFVSYKPNSLHLIASREAPYVRGSITHLNYKVCKYDNIKIAFKHAIAESVGKPVAAPDYKMIELPIWSTWAKFRADINGTTLLEYANSIIKYGYPNSQLEIDDQWQSCHGSLAVHKKFPDMKGLVEKLHSMGFRVTAWVHPFINTDCQPYFNEGVKKNFFIRRANGSVTSQWWNGATAVIDFTNPEAADWYTMRLHKILDQTGIDSYKFDAGESSYFPKVPILHAMMEDHPDTLMKAYIHTVASFGDMVEVRAARRTQKYQIYTRMMDRNTRWHGPLSITTFIPELLHMNIIGYPFVLPDMIGGNYAENDDRATKEMFIRWLQATVFMPSLQFSVPPWDFDEQVISLTRKYIELHKRYAPTIYELMKRATKEETMVNAPLWWIDPTDPTALTIDSEFLLGDLLVAPVLEKGATSRDIYFPKGTWRDETDKTAPYINGPTWVRNYPAPLEVLPHFTKMSESASSSSALSPTILVVCITFIFFVIGK